MPARKKSPAQNILYGETEILPGDFDRCNMKIRVTFMIPMLVFDVYQEESKREGIERSELFNRKLKIAADAMQRQRKKKRARK